jgi:flagellar hook-length control protein FliK
MIQGLIPVAPSAPEVSTAPAAPAVPDKSFSSVLKRSVQNTAKPENSRKMVSSEDNAKKDVAGSTKASTEKGSGSRRESETVKDSTDVKETKESQPEQDPNEILRQLVFQMTAIAQQIVNQPVLKDVSAAAAALASQGAQAAQAAQSAQAALMPPITDLSKEAAQLSSGSVTATQGENYLAAFAANQGGTAEKMDFKLPDKISANSKDALLSALKGFSQDNSTNAIPPTADSAKTEAELQAFSQAGKNAASLSKTAGSSDDALSQFKIESSSGAAASQTSGDKNNSREASGLYAQTIQGQTASGHEQSPIQETVLASKLTSLDAVIAKAVDSGQRNLIIRIDPPDLGSMHIRLSLDSGVLKANITVDSSSIKDSFNLALPQIKTTLENAGIKVSDFHVDVRDDQSRNGQDRNNQGQQQKQGRGLKNAFSDFFA